MCISKSSCVNIKHLTASKNVMYSYMEIHLAATFIEYMKHTWNMRIFYCPDISMVIHSLFEVHKGKSHRIQRSRNTSYAWWRHQMETFTTSLALCVGNSPITGGFPSQRPVTWGFDVFVNLRLNKRLNKQSGRRRFETLSRSLWSHCNVFLRTCRLYLVWAQVLLQIQRYNVSGHT